MASNDYRDNLIPFNSPRLVEARGLDPHEFAKAIKATPRAIGLIDLWQSLYDEPFKGITSNGVVEKVSEQEIADAKAVIGRCGIGCEPASAATLAGIRKLVAAGTIARDADVVAILTGNVLKDPDYIHRYHTGALEDPSGRPIRSTYGNAPEVVPADDERIARLLTK